MSAPTLNFAFDATKAVVSIPASKSGLVYTSSGKLTLVSGLAVSDGLNYGGFGNDQFVNGPLRSANGGLIPQTLTTAVYQNLHLVAGSTLKIVSEFIPGEQHYRDEAITLLKNVVTGGIIGQKIADVQKVIDNNGATRYITTFNITSTSTFNLLVGVADIGDSKHPSTLKVEQFSVDVPGGQYSFELGGVRLADGSLLRSDGSVVVGNTVQPSVLSNSSAAFVGGLEALLASNKITALGAGLITQDGGSLISQDGGSIVSHDAGGVVSNDGGSVVSNDGGSLLAASSLLGPVSSAQLLQIGAGILANNSSRISAYRALSASGLTSGTISGLMTLDGASDPESTGSGTTYTAPVPGLEVNASSGAVANRYDDGSAVADLGGGKYVVAFTEYTQDPTTYVKTYAIRAQIFNADGTTSGSELTASPALPGTTIYGTSANVLTSTSIASLGNGSFVIAWENASNIRPGASGGFSTGADLFAQVFNADGSKLGTQISLDAGTTDAQYVDVKVVALTGGGFVAVWGQTASATNSLSSIHGKIYNADGTQRGAEFSISGNAVLADLRQPAVTATNGGFAISFQGKTTNPSTGSAITGIGAQRYTADGTALLRNPAVVAISDTQNLQKSNLALLSSGNYAVAWYDAATPGATQSLYSLVLNPDLTPVQTQPTLVTTLSTVYNGAPSVAALSDGTFVVGYTNYASADVEAQIMSAANTTVGPAFNIYAPGGGDAEANTQVLQLSTGTLIASSTHKFYYLPGSDVRALPLALSGTTPTSSTASGAALKVGAAVHGYVSGGTVFADANGNGVLDAGEISATTTADGFFALAPGATGTLVLTGGTDVATGRPFVGRYTAPAGSDTVDALTTLVQRIMASGVDVGTAQMKVATAFGLAADAALTQLDPMVASQSGDTGRAILLANALLADVTDLAIAAGSANPLAVFASMIAAQPGFTSFDPSSSSALQAAGLTGQTLTDTSAIAAAIKALLTTKGTADAANPAQLVADVNRAEVIVQTGIVPALQAAIMTGTTSAVAAAYTGAGLAAKFSGTDTGGTGTINPTPITPASVGVFRFFDSKYGTHFFTGSTAERDSILANRADLVSEGVGLQSVDPAANDPNAAAVYRFFDTKFGTHFFTASAAERDQVIAGRADLAFEGTGFYEHTAQQSGDVAVYRFFDKNFGTHFYTADAGERAGILATRSDLADEGIGFYAPKASM